jgi:hypothetical protein
MSVNNYSALGDSFEKIRFRKITVIIEIKKLEGLVKEGIRANFRGSFVLQLVF